MFFYTYGISLLLVSFLKISLCQISRVDLKKQKPFDFHELVKENENFSDFEHYDYCPLRIKGGITVPRGYVPYQIALRVPYGKSRMYTYCGGSLVTLQHVLTAAHCITGDWSPKLKTVVAVAGSIQTIADFNAKGQQTRRIRRFFSHKYFSDTYFYNDIAVLELLRAFVENRFVKPIRMVSDEHYVHLKQRKLVLIVGYGDMEDGDSGGPVVFEGTLVGITSWGGDCGDDPGVYVRLSSYTTAETPVPFVEVQAKRGTNVKANFVTLAVAIVLGWICGLS